MVESADTLEKVYVKLTDFGFASQGVQDLHHYIGTPFFMAPELYDQSERYDFKVDIWAFGIIAYFMVTGGKFPFATEEEFSDFELD